MKENSVLNKFLAKSSISFEENKGQILSAKDQALILFKAQSTGVNIYVTEKGLSYLFIRSERTDKHTSDSLVYSYDRFDIELKGAKIKKENILKERQSSEDYRFFYAHCKDGITDVKHFSRLVVRDVYPGIDWVLYGSDSKGLKYDFVVHPGADPGRIKLLYRSLGALTLHDDALQLNLSKGNFKDSIPLSYLQVSGSEIDCHFNIGKQVRKNYEGNFYYETEVTFDLGSYNKSESLIIDPLQLWWGTYYGGTTFSEGNSIISDSLGNIFVLGSTYAFDLPVQPYGSLAYFQSPNGHPGHQDYDCFVLKFTNQGQLLWATYLGGTGEEYGRTIRCDRSNNVFLTGYTTAPDFPAKNAGGNCYFKDSLSPLSSGFTGYRIELFVCKFSNQGQYLWGTYYQADNYYRVPESTMAIDNKDNVYITGTTGVNFQFFNPGGSAYFDNTLGGSQDAFILKFSNQGVLLLATYFGGSDSEDGYGVTTDGFGNAYFTGRTYSTDLYLKNPGGNAYYQPISPILPVLSDAYILKLDSNCKATWSTCFGGSVSELFWSLACDRAGNLFLSGMGSSSSPAPVDPGGGALALTENNGNNGMMIAKFSPQSQLVWFTHFKGKGAKGNLCIGKCDEVYVSVGMDGTCSWCPPAQFKNPGHGAYFDSIPGDQGSNTDIFILSFTNLGALRWSTLFGGKGEEMGMVFTTDKNGNLFYTGNQGSLNYNTTSDLQTYYNACIVNPGNNAFFQPAPYNVTASLTLQGSCVIGRFNGPSPNSNLVTSGCGATNSASIQAIDGWGPFTYTWSTGAHGDSIVNVPPGMYTYSVSDPLFGCSEHRTLYLGAPSLSLTTLVSGNSICKGETAQLSASGANSFSWSPPQGLNQSSGSSVLAHPFMSTTYTVTGFNALNCSSDTTILLTVNPLPSVSVLGADSACKGSAVTFTAKGAQQYSWNIPNLTHTISTNTETLVVQLDRTSVLILTGADLNNCVSSDTFSIKAIDLPHLLTSGTATLCSGKSTTLSATGAETFRWRPVKYLNYSDSTTVVVSPPVNTSYTLTGINGKLCRDSVTFTVKVSQPSSLSINAPDSICAELEFDISANGRGNLNWFSSGIIGCSNCKTARAKINTATRFFVLLLDSNLCVTYDSVEVQIKSDCEFELIIPNIFTPNHDNVNDVFKITGKNFSEFNCRIIDRWGNFIFSFHSIDGFWTGYKPDGSPYDDGTYYYLIETKDLQNKSHVYKGPLQLMR